MKATIKQVVECYKTLGDAKVTKLEEAEVVKVVKNRKAIRKFADEYDAFLKDVQEKMKPEHWDDVQQKVQQWQQEGENTTLTELERKGINTALVEYTRKVDSAISEELKREVEIDIEALKSESATKLLTENGWEVKKLDEIEIVL